MKPRQVFSVLQTAAIAAGVLLSAGAASATIVERVVAVVGDRPVLLSDVRKRTKPFLNNLPGDQSARAAAKSQLFSEMLSRMVDEELLRRSASRSQITVTNPEIEAAIERVAKGNGVTVEQLLKEVERSGVNPGQYRIELRRQLLDAKVINLRLQGRIRVSEDDLRAEYEELKNGERAQLEFRAAVVRIQVPKAASSSEIAALRKTARRVSKLAQSGSDFAELSRTYSTDPQTQESGGLLPPMRANQLPDELSRAALTLEVGETSAPIRSGDAFVVLKIVERDPSRIPEFDQAAGQLQQRVQMRKMEKARRVWLDGLRKRTHVEIRL